MCNWSILSLKEDFGKMRISFFEGVYGIQLQMAGEHACMLQVLQVRIRLFVDAIFSLKAHFTQGAMGISRVTKVMRMYLLYVRR